MEFTRAVIDTLASEGRVDRSRVYATGFSNGGVFVQRLACFMPERIAAVAVAGTRAWPPTSSSTAAWILAAGVRLPLSGG